MPRLAAPVALPTAIPRSSRSGSRRRRRLLAALLSVLLVVAVGVGLAVWAPRSSAANLVLSGHTGGVNGVAVTQLDGKPIAVTGSGDDTVRMWDLTTGQQLGQPFTGHTDAVWAVATTQLDGRPVAVTGSRDTTAYLGTGQQPDGTPFTSAAGQVSAVAITRIGDRPVTVVASSNFRDVQIWDLTTAQQRDDRPLTERLPRGALTGHTGSVFAVATTRLDNRPVAVTGSSNDTARIWDLLAAASL